MACASCDSSLVPSTERLNDDHYAVQFGDFFYEARLDGGMEPNVVEVFVGPHGKALVYEFTAYGKPYLCDVCGGALAARWVTGNWSVRFLGPDSLRKEDSHAPASS